MTPFLNISPTTPIKHQASNENPTLSVSASLPDDVCATTITHPYSITIPPQIDGHTTQISTILEQGNIEILKALQNHASALNAFQPDQQSQTVMKRALHQLINRHKNSYFSMLCRDYQTIEWNDPRHGINKHPPDNTPEKIQTIKTLKLTQSTINRFYVGLVAHLATSVQCINYLNAAGFITPEQYSELLTLLPSSYLAKLSISSHITTHALLPLMVWVSRYGKTPLNLKQWLTQGDLQALGIAEILQHDNKHSPSHATYWSDKKQPMPKGNVLAMWVKTMATEWIQPYNHQQLVTCVLQDIEQDFRSRFDDPNDKHSSLPNKDDVLQILQTVNKLLISACGTQTTQAFLQNPQMPKKTVKTHKAQGAPASDNRARRPSARDIRNLQ